MRWHRLDRFEVSRHGQVRHHGKILVQYQLPKGYCHIAVQINKVRTHFYVHRLVALAFLGPPPTPTHEVDHKNRKRDDNRAENLEWVTSGENKRRAGIRPPPQRGEKNWKAKLTAAKVRVIRQQLRREIPPKMIAAMHGVQPGAISKIRCGRSWAHVP